MLHGATNSSTTQKLEKKCDYLNPVPRGEPACSASMASYSEATVSLFLSLLCLYLIQNVNSAPQKVRPPT